MQNLSESLSALGSTIVDRVAQHLPSILGAIVLLIAGWALARVARAFTVRSVLLLDALITRLGVPTRIESARVRRASAILGATAFWTVLLIFVTLATQVLELRAFTDWLARLVDYLPVLAAGVLIIAAGYVLSRFVADLVLATATRLAAPQRKMLARVAQVAILVGAILVGADQVGIKVTFLAIFAAAVAMVVGGGVALAVGLGARTYVANLIGTHYLRQAVAVGQTIRVAGHEGRIVDIGATTFVLESEGGRVMIPGRLYSEQPVELIKTGPDA